MVVGCEIFLLKLVNMFGRCRDLGSMKASGVEGYRWILFLEVCACIIRKSCPFLREVKPNSR